MKILFVTLTSLILCACASDPGSQRLIEVGESCAKIGKAILVANWQDPPSPFFWDSYLAPELEVKCR